MSALQISAICAVTKRKFAHPGRLVPIPKQDTQQASEQLDWNDDDELNDNNEEEALNIFPIHEPFQHNKDYSGRIQHFIGMFYTKCNVPSDAYGPLMALSQSSGSKQNFLTELHAICAQYNIASSGMIDILCLLNKYCESSVNIGNCLSSRSVNKYVALDYRSYKVDVCINGCQAYLIPEVRCSVCNENRFTDCTKPNCSHPFSCNPFTGPHGIKYRTPRAAYYYRPLIPLLMNLIRRDLEENLNLFEFEQEKHSKMGVMEDILDGAQAISNRKEMDQKFEMFASGRSGQMHQRSFLLTEFYDGGALFDRSQLTVWPLCITILNCNPSDRVRMGIGLFLIALHSLSCGTSAEQSIYKELFVPELDALYNGIEFSANNLNVFLQARLIGHSQDTKALEKTTMLQGAGALKACMLCNTVTGTSRSGEHPYRRVIYIGHRIVLPDEHWLRYCGLSGQCCPKGYYKGDDIDRENICKSLIAKIATLSVNSNIRPTLHTPNLTEKIRSNCLGNTFTVRPSDIMANDQFLMKEFVKYVEFAHCDFRPVTTYTRRLESFYIAAADKINGGTIFPDGVRGKCVFSSVPSAGIEKSFCYDPFHALKNMAESVIEVLAGRVGADDRHLLAHHAELRFISLREGRGYPWVLQNSDKEFLDKVMNCVLPPSGSPQLPRDPLRKSSMLKGMEKIAYVSAYLPFCLSMSKLAGQYKSLFCLVSSVLSDIQSPVFDESTAQDSQRRLSLEKVFMRTAEMLSLYEGMLPDTVQQLSHHELLDIAFFIRRLGPVRCWWTLPGERLMKKMKDGVPDGGCNPLKTAYERYVAKENAAILRRSKIVHYRDNNGKYSDNHIRLLDDAQGLVEWTRFEDDWVFKGIYNAVQTCDLFEWTDELKSKSAFYRLYEEYLLLKSKENFRTWLRCYRNEVELDATSNMAVEDILNWKPAYHTNGIIKGIQFACRGLQHSERRALESMRASSYGAEPIWQTHSNSLNDISKQWFKREQYSSWCKILYWISDDQLFPRVHYGQLNYFFRIHWPYDEILNGLCMASVTVRTKPISAKCRDNYRQVNASDEVYSGFSFIPAYYIESTPIAVCGIDVDGEPVCKTSGQLKDLSKLILIDMNPERKYVQCSYNESKINEKNAAVQT